MPLVRLESISKRYRDAPILENLDLSIDAGEFIALIGRSGAGKSTLLRILGGLEPPDTGTVCFAGADITQMSEADLAAFRRRSLGFVFQSFNLVDTLTIAENVAIPLHLNGYSRSDIRERVAELLAQLDIHELAEQFPDMLSGGEQQRAAIARALAHRPKLVIADEPTGNLDEQTATSVMRLLAGECANHQASLIVATHSDEVTVQSHATLQLIARRLEPVG